MRIEPLPRTSSSLTSALAPADTAGLPDALAVELMGVWESAVRATHSFLGEDDIVALRREVPGYFGAVSLWGAYDTEGRLAGFAGIAGESLEMLFVRAEARGRGFGGALLRQAVALGVTALDVNEQNPEARAFYEHMGFTVTGRSERDGQGRPFPLLRMRLKN